jgi:cardiolipin synthase
MHGMYYAITTAQEYVYIQTPYFMPPDEVLVAIQTAALRGVDVRLIIPTKSDTTMAQASNNSYIERLLEAGVRVYWYNKGFLHSKTMVIDNLISSIGTTNMDFRSFEQNFEVNAFIYEEETALKLKSLFLKDTELCIELELENWKDRPKIKRIKESLSRLFSPAM